MEEGGKGIKSNEFTTSNVSIHKNLTSKTDESLVVNKNQTDGKRNKK